MLYGTTSQGGANGYIISGGIKYGLGDGTVFKIDPNSNTLTTIASFNNATTGSQPVAPLYMNAIGDLFGTTANGGSPVPGKNSTGTVFMISAGSQTITDLASFNGSNGSFLQGGLIADSQGNLYGTTQDGGNGFNGSSFSGKGTIFEIAAGTHELTTLYGFTGPDGQNPVSELVADSAGNFYGTTTSGGANNLGTVFEISAGTHELTTIYSFSGGASGFNPRGGLMIDAEGNLYGTTVFGGNPILDYTSGAGTVFEIAAGTHAFNTIYTFNGLDGAAPYSTLIADANGNLYGTTFSGGADHSGTAFELVRTVPEPSSVLLTCLSVIVLLMGVFVAGRKVRNYQHI